MDQHTPSTSYLTLLEKCDRDTSGLCICEAYPCHKTKQPTAKPHCHCDETTKQTNGDNKKGKCPHLNCLDKWNYKRNYLITATILATTILILATVTSLVIWSLVT